MIGPSSAAGAASAGGGTSCGGVLSCAGFVGAGFSGTEFSGAVFSGAVFSGTGFSWANRAGDRPEIAMKPSIEIPDKPLVLRCAFCCRILNPISLCLPHCRIMAVMATRPASLSART
ncbi:MAG: pentapeptide repeat-containing protein [Sphingobium sp.]